jgi:hypothetical protein
VRVLAGIIAVMALVIGLVPQFTNCEARSAAMPGTAVSSAASGGGAAMSPPQAVSAMKPTMKCLWTARAEIGVAVPLFLIGALLLVSRRKETLRALAILAVALGAVTMLLPTALIGVCASAGAVCRTSLLPSMLIAGGLTVAASIAVALVNEFRPHEPQQRRSPAEMRL